MDFSCPTCGSSYRQDLRMVTREGVSRSCWDQWHNLMPEPPLDLEHEPVQVTVRTDDGRLWGPVRYAKDATHLEEVRS